MALIKCSGCGHMISDKVSKCPKCGMPMVKAESVFTEEKKEMVNTEVEHSKVESISPSGRINENTRNNKNGIVAAICGIAIVVLAVGAFILWKNSNGFSSSGYEPQLVDGHPVYSEELLKYAQKGNPDAQCDLGICYNFGFGIEQNYSEAVHWYRKAAEQGNASAQLNLGNRYANGDGVEQNYSEAVRWYRKAAEQGEAGAQYNLGLFYYNIEQNYSEAVRWYRKAAEQGYASAQLNLGNCYFDGDGVEQNHSEAVRWFRKAAEQGNASAQLNLGFCYYYGFGIEQNYLEAVRWYRKAAEQGNERAIEKLNEIGL